MSKTVHADLFVKGDHQQVFGQTNISQGLPMNIYTMSISLIRQTLLEIYLPITCNLSTHCSDNLLKIKVLPGDKVISLNFYSLSSLYAMILQVRTVKLKLLQWSHLVSPSASHATCIELNSVYNLWELRVREESIDIATATT